MSDIQRLIYGKNNIQRIVSCEVKDSSVELFIQQPDGTILSDIRPNKYWMLAHNKLDNDFQSLEGNLFYKHIKLYDNKDNFLNERKVYYRDNTFSVWNDKESAMLYRGFTYYKGLTPSDVTVLSFDIESTTLEHNADAKVLIIANTLRHNNVVTRKMFCYDEYPDQASLINAWCEWVRQVNPSIIVAHNGVIFDFPYLNYIAQREGTELYLGRDGSPIEFEDRESLKRKDGSQSYSYHKISIYGREVIDTFFLAITYDVQRKYENYKLKNIIKQEGLEVANRQFYDGDLIRTNYTIPEEWEKIKKYAGHDGDDALALFDLMAPSYFYFAQSVPKSFQNITESATGSQLNAIMIRSYLQDGHSLPLESSSVEYEGAISLGNPGNYKDVMKVDVASLYPSIILTYNVYDKQKDPKGNFLKMVQYFTEERLANKKKAKETGDRFYKDLEQSQKIAINSAYGFLGANRLLFNSPANAAFITEKGREILQKALAWAMNNSFNIVNADTDSISFTTGGPLSKEEQNELLLDLNYDFPGSIKWEHDGYYAHVLVVKAKNYYLETSEGKVTIKGSALKASMKEPALKEFCKDFLSTIVKRPVEDQVSLYNKYIDEIINLSDITRWASRKTVTASVLNPERTNEQKVLDAIGDEEVQEGDKLSVYFAIDSSLKLADHWCNDHDPYKLIEKLWKTVNVFSTVVDMTLFPKYHLKRQRKLLDNFGQTG